MLINATHSTMINSPVRSIKGKVELYEGSTLLNTFEHTGDLKSFTVERVGEGRFFGYGYCQKINIKLLDTNRQKEITTANSFALKLGVNSSYVTSFPKFNVTEVHRDEKNNLLSITAYDNLKEAAEHVYSELNLSEAYPNSVTLAQIASTIATFLGISGVKYENLANNTIFSTSYTYEQLNFEGKESLRSVLTSIAQVTETIYYINYENKLVFKRLDVTGAAKLTIDKSQYFDFKSKTNRRLKQITFATNLGNNAHISIAAAGTEEVFMDNPFYELYEDFPTLLNQAEPLLGMCINQFEMKWRGNYLLEIGDKIDLVCKDGSVETSYLLDDTFVYDGTVEQESQWTYKDTNQKSEHSNPTNIGEAFFQTFSRVDKVEKQIDLVVSDVEDNKGEIASVKITQDAIEQQVQAQNTQITGLTQRVNQTVTAEQLEIEVTEIQQQIDSIDTSEVTTTTGFTFNADGLTVQKTGSQMKTQITEDGMKVVRNNEEVLIADNTGVWAEDLHATTYLLIGSTSRFENYAENTRTGCFWIGGAAN